MSKILVALVHLSYSDPPTEIKLNELTQQPSITVLVSANNSTQTPAAVFSLSSLVASSSETNSNNKSVHINTSDSIIHTLLSIISKRDLINEQSSKYLIQYFQFFNFYSSLGIQQVEIYSFIYYNVIKIHKFLIKFF